MAAKDWITQGIGASPGSLLYWLNGGLGSGAAVVPVVPDAIYIIRVPAQNRAVTVAVQDRAVIVAAQDRTVKVQAEPAVTAPAQLRTIVVRRPT